MRRSVLLKVLLLAGVLALLVALIPAAGAEQYPDGRDNQNPGPAAPGPEGGSVDSGPTDLDDPRTRDQVINDDLIVKGSACVGFDCVNGESFGFDTLRLKENNLRIKFDDTSNSASFPDNDWTLGANDSSNGGLERFYIEDVSGGRIPFTVEAGAASNSLYVESSGEVGFGTNNPVTTTHAVNGNTPTHRLEQNGTSGFTPQTWDLAGNETNFFIRDATNGSRLPFRIRPNAPTSSIDIEGTTGDVGFGLASPAHPIHVRRTDGTAKVLIEEASGTNTNRSILELKNNGGAQFDMTDSSGGDSWRLGLVTGAPNPANDKFEIAEDGSAARFRYFKDGRFDIRGTGNVIIFDLDDDGDLEITGDLTAAGTLYTSDRDLKTSFQGVDAKEILASVEALGVETWAFKDRPRTRHIGPMAQDWYAAFGLGSTETTISQTDVNGVVVASIQALAAENDALAAQNQALEERLASLETKLAQLLDDQG